MMLVYGTQKRTRVHYESLDNKSANSNGNNNNTINKYFKCDHGSDLSTALPVVVDNSTILKKKEQRKQYNKEYRQQNKAKQKQYYEANKEKIKEQQKQYRETNKQKLQQYRNE